MARANDVRGSSTDSAIGSSTPEDGEASSEEAQKRGAKRHKGVNDRIARHDPKIGGVAIEV
jgi:hypothetical protein